jgi:hypothetical protein
MGGGDLNSLLKGNSLFQFKTIELSQFKVENSYQGCFLPFPAGLLHWSYFSRFGYIVGVLRALGRAQVG